MSSSDVARILFIRSFFTTWKFKAKICPVIQKIRCKAPNLLDKDISRQSLHKNTFFGPPVFNTTETWSVYASVCLARYSVSIKSCQILMDSCAIQDMKKDNLKSAKILLVTQKYEIVIMLSLYSFFKYCDSNIGLFSIAPCKVFALNCFALFLVSALLLFLIDLPKVIALSRS